MWKIGKERQRVHRENVDLLQDGDVTVVDISPEAVVHFYFKSRFESVSKSTIKCQTQNNSKH